MGRSSLGVSSRASPQEPAKLLLPPQFQTAVQGARPHRRAPPTPPLPHPPPLCVSPPILLRFIVSPLILLLILFLPTLLFLIILPYLLLLELGSFLRRALRVDILLLFLLHFILLIRTFLLILLLLLLRVHGFLLILRTSTWPPRPSLPLLLVVFLCRLSTHPQLT